MLKLAVFKKIRCVKYVVSDIESMRLEDRDEQKGQRTFDIDGVKIGGGLVECFIAI
jgi:hypothetical protein